MKRKLDNLEEDSKEDQHGQPDLKKDAPCIKAQDEKSVGIKESGDPQPTSVADGTTGLPTQEDQATKALPVTSIFGSNVSAPNFTSLKTEALISPATGFASFSSTKPKTSNISSGTTFGSSIGKTSSGSSSFGSFASFAKQAQNLGNTTAFGSFTASSDANEKDSSAAGKGSADLSKNTAITENEDKSTPKMAYASKVPDKDCNGEQSETNVLGQDYHCKLYKLVEMEEQDGGKKVEKGKTWRECGDGPLRILQPKHGGRFYKAENEDEVAEAASTPTDGGQDQRSFARLVMRRERIGVLIMNAVLTKFTQVNHMGEKGLRVVCMVPSGAESYYLKFRDAAEAAVIFKAINKHKQSS